MHTQIDAAQSEIQQVRGGYRAERGSQPLLWSRKYRQIKTSGCVYVFLGFEALVQDCENIPQFESSHKLTTVLQLVLSKRLLKGEYEFTRQYN